MTGSFSILTAIGIFAATHPAATGLTGDQAFARLMQGNARYVSGKMVHPNLSSERRAEQAKGQQPFAVVIGCSDSRVPPELVFDQGIGDLFVIRTAGYRLDALELGSIEYGVEHAGCALVVVLGHETCGAIAAAIAATNPGEEPATHIPSIVREMQDAVEAAKGQPGDPIENTMLKNVGIVTHQLTLQSPYLAARVKAGKLKVVGLRYDVDTGAVTAVVK